MIRPTFLGFEVAKKGFTVSQKGLDITGQNLVNWDSEGYTRQRIEQVVISQDAYRTRTSNNRIGVAGQGVDIAGISQQRDAFLDKRYREQYGDQGYYDKANDILRDIQDSMDMLDAEGDSGLRGRLMALRDSLDTFAGSPDSPTHANIVATNVKSFARTLQALDQKLIKIQEQHTYDLSVEVDDYNAMITRVAEINRAIQEDAGVIGDDARYKPNELFDERNLLIDKLSNMTDLEVTNNIDGTVTLKVPGKEAGSDPDIVLVDGAKHDMLDMDVNDDTGVISLRWLSTAKPAHLTTGSIKASYDVLNGRGEGEDNNIINAGETPVRGVPYYRDKLNEIAQQFANVMNSTIPTAYNKNPETGKPDASQGIDTTQKPVYRKLVGTVFDDAPGADNKVTAANISISYEWGRDSNYIMTQQGDLDTTHILNLKNRLNTEKVFQGSGSASALGLDEGSSFLEFFKSIGTTLGTDISFNDGRFEATKSLADSLNDRRDSVAGVNVDEETANMMLYNKSLQAASRLMTTLDDALDILINRTGRVGL